MSKRFLLLSILILVALCAGSRSAIAQDLLWPRPQSRMQVSTEWLQTHLRSRGVVILDVTASPAE